MKKLNARQERYCQGRAEGKSKAEAYKAAGYCPEGTRRTAELNAAYMDRRSPAATAISQRIEELRQRDAATSILNREDRQKILSDLANDPAVKPQDRIRAMDQLARMSGDYNDRIQIEGKAAVSMTYADRIEAIRAGLQEDA